MGDNFSWFREKSAAKHRLAGRRNRRKRRVLKQQQSMKIMADMMRNIMAKGTTDGSVNCWRPIVKKRGFTENGRTQCTSGTTGLMKRRRVRESEEKRNDLQCGRRNRFIAPKRNPQLGGNVARYGQI